MRLLVKRAVFTMFGLITQVWPPTNMRARSALPEGPAVKRFALSYGTGESCITVK